MDELEGLIKSLGRKGAIEILRALADKNEMNFNKLAKKVGYSATASRVLKGFLMHDLVKKRELKDNLRTVRYSLTEKGLKVKTLLEQMRKM
jgi:DNA-binding HxlR family transcriptional regulator